MLHIYLLEQDWNQEPPCWTACIVVAETEDQARNIHPSLSLTEDTPDSNWTREGWVAQKESHRIKVTELGIADSSFQIGVVQKFN